MAFSETDRLFMHQAIQEAQKALDSGETPVGCVIVRDGKIIARGHNETNATRNGTRHAEMIAIDVALEAERRADFSGCTLYVSCEPCIMCAGALSLLKFQHVIYGCANDKFGGTGSILSIHQDPQRGGCGKRISSTYGSAGGLLKDNAIQLLQEFYISGNPTAPNPHRPVLAPRHSGRNRKLRATTARETGERKE
jgi:tRNA-specific adenosine deaminase 2